MDTESSMDARFLSKVNQLIEDNLGNENFTVDRLSSSGLKQVHASSPEEPDGFREPRAAG